MYIPDPFRQTDPAEMRRFIREYPFATLISEAEAGPFISHIPLYLDEGGEALIGHVARANPHWRLAGAKSVAIFHGPHAYISASWYGARDVVPTWNYAVVHVRGGLSVLDAAETRRVLDRMIAEHEPDPAAFRADLGEAARAGLEKGIVGIAIAIEAWEGKRKMSQNKDASIRSRLAQRLLASGREQDRIVGGMMLPGEGPKPGERE